MRVISNGISQRTNYSSSKALKQNQQIKADSTGKSIAPAACFTLVHISKSVRGLL
ncbi:MAG: hypothetical protein ACJA1E_000556 [Paracoccaceae bacterium]|jgi:hypothetical protein